MEEAMWKAVFINGNKTLRLTLTVHGDGSPLHANLVRRWIDEIMQQVIIASGLPAEQRG